MAPPRQDHTLPAALRRAVAQHADAPFLIGEGGTLTFAEADRRSNQLAHGLAALGIGHGTPVLVMMPNCLAFVDTWLALAKLGAIEVPINTGYRGNSLVHLINDSLASTLVVASEFLECVEAVVPNLGQLDRIVVYGGPEEATLSTLRTSKFQAVRYDDLLTRDPPVPVVAEAGHTDLMAIMYTSGTTGASKGVMICHAHAYRFSQGIAEVLDLRAGDIYYAPLPLFHIAGKWAVVYAALQAGATVVLKDRFSVSEFWADVRRHDVNVTLLLGVMCSFLHRQPPQPTDGDNPLDKVLVVPLLPDIREFESRFNVRVTTMYGSTECGAVLRSGYHSDGTHHFVLHDTKSCGRVVSDRYEAKIVDVLDEEVPPGTVGEFVVRPKEPWLMMCGYWNSPAKTTEAWRNLWFHTGDAMYADAEGNFYFVDRLKDTIRRRGENISSVEVESELEGHPSVLECAVYAVPSEHTEDEVMAAVVLRHGEVLEPGDLIAWLEPRVPPFALPRYVEMLPDLPKTSTGKVQKFPLRERGVGPLTWDRQHRG